MKKNGSFLFLFTPILTSDQGRLYGCDLHNHTWPLLRGALSMVECSAVTVLKFLTFQQGHPAFSFCSGPQNYIASPAAGPCIIGFIIPSCIIGFLFS